MKLNPVMKQIARSHVQLMRANLLPGMSEKAMVLTTTGRKSGRQFSVVVRYVRDGGTIVALNPGGESNWFKNLEATPQATLEIKGTKYDVVASKVTDPAERQHIFELFEAGHGEFMSHIFDLPKNPTAEDKAVALASREFMRFVPVSEATHAGN
jgi:deazaflavin-dependent oxidoreductase (nitroreductase family)